MTDPSSSDHADSGNQPFRLSVRIVTSGLIRLRLRWSHRFSNAAASSRDSRRRWPSKHERAMPSCSNQSRRASQDFVRLISGCSMDSVHS